jgi:hypothetical protein
MAEGDKKRVKNPVFEEGCVTQFPEQIDKDKCEEVPASEQSGMTVFFCDTVMITVCND